MVAGRRFACAAALLQIPTVDYDDPVNSAHSCQLPDGHVNCQFRCCRGGWKQITLRLRKTGVASKTAPQMSRISSIPEQHRTASTILRAGTEWLVGEGLFPRD